MNFSVSDFTPETPFKVVLCHLVLSWTWSHPNLSDDDVYGDEAPDTHLSPDTDVNHVKWSLD